MQRPIYVLTCSKLFGVCKRMSCLTFSHQIHKFIIHLSVTTPKDIDKIIIIIINGEQFRVRVDCNMQCATTRT